MRPNQARRAASPVTFCSRMAGTSDAMTARVRATRMPGKRRARSRTSGRPVESGAAPPVDPDQVAALVRGVGRRPVPRPRIGSCSPSWASARSRRRRPASGRPARPRPGRAGSSDRPARATSGPSVRARSSGPSTGHGSRGHGGQSVRVPIWTQVAPKSPPIGLFAAKVPRTCDASESSRAWRSSPCSPRSPSPDRSDQGPQPCRPSGSGPLPTRRGLRCCPRAGDDEPPLDPGARSAGALDQRSTMFEPATRTEPPQARVQVAQPSAPAEVIVKHPWRTDRDISGTARVLRQADGLRPALTTKLVGVAHRTLPCGTKVDLQEPV